MQYLLFEKNEKILTSEELFTKLVFLQTAKELINEPHPFTVFRIRNVYACIYLWCFSYRHMNKPFLL